MRRSNDVPRAPGDPGPRWRTAWLGLATSGDISEGPVRVCVAAGRRFAVSRIDGVLYAVADGCTLDRAPFLEVLVAGFAVECTRAGCRFDMRNGRVLRGPATLPLASFPVRVVHGHVEVELPAEGDEPA